MKRSFLLVLAVVVAVLSLTAQTVFADRADELPQSAIKEIKHALYQNAYDVKKDLGLEVETLTVGRSVPIDILRAGWYEDDLFYNRENDWELFRSDVGWYVEINDGSGTPRLSIELLPEKDGFISTLSMGTGEFIKAADLVGSLANKTGGSAQARLISYGSNLSVHCYFGEDHRVMTMNGGIDPQYYQVTDYRQLPTFEEYIGAIKAKEDRVRSQTGILWGGSGVMLAPDLNADLSGGVRWILPAGVAVLAVIAAALGAASTVKSRRFSER